MLRQFPVYIADDFAFQAAIYSSLENQCPRREVLLSVSPLHDICCFMRWLYYLVCQNYQVLEARVWQRHNLGHNLRLFFLAQP